LDNGRKSDPARAHFVTKEKFVNTEKAEQKYMIYSAFRADQILVPAVAVIPVAQALLNITECKGYVGGFLRHNLKG